MTRKDQHPDDIFRYIAFAAISIAFVFWGAAVIVAIHFIVKFW